MAISGIIIEAKPLEILYPPSQFFLEISTPEKDVKIKTAIKARD